MISDRPNIMPCYPFKDVGFGIKDVSETLTRTGLGFPGYYKWRSRSGCYFCFYQQRGEWARLRTEHPHLFDKAKTFEKVADGRRYTWVQGRTLDEVADAGLGDAHEKPDPLAADGCAVPEPKRVMRPATAGGGFSW